MEGRFTSLYGKLERLDKMLNGEDPFVSMSLSESLHRLTDMCIAMTEEAKSIRHAEADRIIDGI